MESSTKRHILIGLLALAGVLLLAAGVWYFLFQAQFAVYKDSQYGFSIKYPRSWKQVVHPQEGVGVVFVTPKENAFDAFQENVNITIQDVPADLATLKSFSDKILLQMQKVFKNIKVAESKELVFGERKGYRAVFVAEKPDAVTILTQWVVKGGEKAYILTYMAMTKKYKTYLPQVEAMTRSFALK